MNTVKILLFLLSSFLHDNYSQIVSYPTTIGIDAKKKEVTITMNALLNLASSENEKRKVDSTVKSLVAQKFKWNDEMKKFSNKKLKIWEENERVQVEIKFHYKKEADLEVFGINSDKKNFYLNEARSVKSLNENFFKPDEAVIGFSKSKPILFEMKEMYILGHLEPQELEKLYLKMD